MQGKICFNIIFKVMNLQAILFPTYYVLWPFAVVSPPVTGQQAEVASEEQTREQVRRNDASAVEREFYGFVNIVKLYGAADARLDWQNILWKINRKNVPTVDEIENIYSGGTERYKIYAQRNKSIWKEEDLALFFWVLDKYCVVYDKYPRTLKPEDWEQVARLLPSRTGEQCMFKYLSTQQNKLQDHPWDPKSQQYLFQLAKLQEKKDWVSISRELYKAFPDVYRSSKQCRERWSLNASSVADKSNTLWTLEEDITLLENYREFGRRWKKISVLLVGRSQNAIKNRFTLLWKKYKKRKSNNSIDEIKEQLMKKKAQPPVQPDALKIEGEEIPPHVNEKTLFSH